MVFTKQNNLIEVALGMMKFRLLEKLVGENLNFSTLLIFEIKLSH